jgi:dTDP-4-amino-4,6-dideoxygalactose transaminase
LGSQESVFIQEALDSNYVAPLGPMVDAFEQEFSETVGIPYCLAVSSGTAALHLALRVIGVGSGDEVLASTMTFIGSVSPILFQEANPLFVDSEPASWNMDPDLLAKALETCEKVGRRPKAVVPTDLYGQCGDYDRIFEVCEHYRVPVIVDSAEAMGAKYYSSKLKAQSQEVHAGVGSKAAIFSFNGNKILTTSGGGMLASEDQTLIERARFLSQQARDPAPHYEHSEIGYNYRMSNILAAIGRGQLKVLNERVEKKRQIFDYYRMALEDLPGVEFMPEPKWSRSNRWLTVILIDPKKFGAERETVRLALEAENIESRPVWKPMHLQPVFRGCRVVGGAVSEDLFARGLCLPSGTAMTEEDLERVIRVIRSCHFKR